MEERRAEEGKTAVIDLEELGRAIVSYDDVTDTLYIVLSDEEGEESLLLPNDIAVRISRGRVVSITVRGVRYRS
ncbi:MAG: DUF2283 domain-containing protein [Crenarchaeota archaeon]|nr:DUF2283 domain-containing protein [Thermoproteota archaeon]